MQSRCKAEALKANAVSTPISSIERPTPLIVRRSIVGMFFDIGARRMKSRQDRSQYMSTAFPGGALTRQPRCSAMRRNYPSNFDRMNASARVRRANHLCNRCPCLHYLETLEGASHALFFRHQSTSLSKRGKIQIFGSMASRIFRLRAILDARLAN